VGGKEGREGEWMKGDERRKEDRRREKRGRAGGVVHLP